MGVERRIIVTRPHQHDDDEPTVTCAELGSLVRKAVEQLRPEAEAVVRLLDDLMEFAGELEVSGDAMCPQRSSAVDLQAVMTFHLPNDMRAVGDYLRSAGHLLKFPEMAEGEI
jgi:hypothetical protein